MSRFGLRLLSCFAACAVSGCGASDPAVEPVPGEPAATVRFVHVAWPGRPLSDEMDRAVFGDPRVARALGPHELLRTTVAEVSAEVGSVLSGVGTVCLGPDGEPVSVRAGPSGLGEFLEFLERGPAVLVRRRQAGSDVLALSRLDVRHGLARRALDSLVDVPGPAAALLRTEAGLRLGDLAAARTELRALPPSAQRDVLNAWLAVLDARPGAALRALDGLGANAECDAGAASFWRGRALVDLGRRVEAFAVLERLAAAGDPQWSPVASESLRGMVRNAGGHSHAADGR